MNKIICDICGTSYPDTSDQCPICGCARGAASALLGDSLLDEEITEETPVKATKRREIFDFDEVNAEMEDEEVEDDDYDEDDDDEEDEDEEEGGHSTFAVILLTMLIIALLAVAGFLFVRYFLPNMGSDEKTPATTAPVQMEETAVQTGIPCQSLVLTSGTAELSQEGQYFLLHVQAMPEDTTDVITFTSADESIATVTQDGKITAVSEGETIVYITCGNSQLNCPVVVQYVEETVPPTQATEATEAAQNTEPAVAETEAAVVEPTAPAQTGLKDVTLKLKKTDIGLGVYYQYTLELDCDLEPTEVTWSSEHPHIAKVDENGVVQALKEGTTAIIVKYGDQTVQCIIRCHF